MHYVFLSLLSNIWIVYKTSYDFEWGKFRFTRIILYGTHYDYTANHSTTVPQTYYNHNTNAL